MIVMLTLEHVCSHRCTVHCRQCQHDQFSFVCGSIYHVTCSESTKKLEVQLVLWVQGILVRVEIRLLEGLEVRVTPLYGAARASFLDGITTVMSLATHKTKHEQP